MAGIIKSLLRSSSSNKMSITNSNEINKDNIEQKLRSWKLPKVNTSELYVKPFELRQTYVIKMVESAHFVTDSNMSLQLFPKYALQKLMKKGFRFIHLGLVQVGVQPLTKNGLNDSITAIACIRDKRHKEFKDSLLGLVESTCLCNGPMYFNCFPNFSVSLSDPHIMKVLSLDLQTNGCYYGGDIAVVYRIYYKAMDTIAPYCKYSTVKPGTTTLFQTNLDVSIVTVVSKSVRWDDVTPPESWILEDQTPKSRPEGASIITTEDGRVMIRFNRNSSSSSSMSSSSQLPNIYNVPPRRHSTSSVTSSSSFNDAKDHKGGLESSSSSGIFTQNHQVSEVESSTPESAGGTTTTTTPNVSDDISIDTNQLIQY